MILTKTLNRTKNNYLFDFFNIYYLATVFYDDYHYRYSKIINKIIDNQIYKCNSKMQYTYILHALHDFFGRKSNMFS